MRPVVKAATPAVISALAVLGAFALVACTDDKPPAGRTASQSAISSGSDLALATSMARTLADGLQQGAGGRITSAQSDCVVAEIVARVHTNVLAGIASNAPDPKSLPRDVRTAFAAAFDRCLPGDVAAQLKQRLGL